MNVLSDNSFEINLIIPSDKIITKTPIKKVKNFNLE